jgi:hypothetical protein
MERGDDFDGIVPQSAPPWTMPAAAHLLLGSAAGGHAGAVLEIDRSRCVLTYRQALIGAFLGTDAGVKGCLWAVPAVRPALCAAGRALRQ